LRDPSVGVDFCLFDLSGTAEFKIRRKATGIDKKRARVQTDRDSPWRGLFSISCAMCRFLSVRVDVDGEPPRAFSCDANRQE
jgi:hypothetical protein